MKVEIRAQSTPVQSTPPATGRIYGHDKDNAHKDVKHINIKLPDGRKVNIIIQRLR